MKVTFKTLDHATFEEEVGAEEGVEDLISKMEDRLGQENLYRLIYAGKMMKEGEMVSDYKMTGRLPVVVMVTKLDQFRKDEREAEDGPKAKRVRTESEDSGFGDDSEEGEEEHYVTDREFSIALEVVMTCQHFRRPSELVSGADMRLTVEETFPEEAEVREIICSRMEQLEEAGPTREQFKAFILDIQSMYQEGRVVPGVVVAGHSSRNNTNNTNVEAEAEVEEVDESLLERNLRQLEGMGFPRDQAAGALGRSSGSLQVALDLLLPRGPETPPPLPALPNPLAFLRDLPEFQFLRFLVLQQPDLLQPLLISFGQSHPEVMRTIHEHREQFVAMLYEQTGGATSRHARHH